MRTCAPRSLQDADEPVSRFRACAPAHEEDVTFGSEARDARLYDRAEQAPAGLLANGDLRATVQRLLDEPSFTTAAQRIASEIAALPEPAL